MVPVDYGIEKKYVHLFPTKEPLGEMISPPRTQRKYQINRRYKYQINRCYKYLELADNISRRYK